MNKKRNFIKADNKFLGFFISSSIELVKIDIIHIEPNQL